MKYHTFFAAASTVVIVVTHGSTIGAGAARAQMSPDLIMETYNSNINAIVSSRINAHVLDQAIRRNGGGRGSHGSRTASSTRSAVHGSTRFRPSAAVRQRTLTGLVNKARATNPQGADALQRDFAKGDPIAAIAPGLARYSLRTDDVADAMTAYLVSAWYGVRGSNEDPAPWQVRATREQVHRILLSSPQFASSSDQTKQQMADALLLQLMVTDRLVTSAKGDPSKMVSAKNTIQQAVLKTFQLDLTKAKLTEEGLRL